MSLHYKHNPLYQEAEKLYNLSIAYQKQGDQIKSTESYLAALEIQAQMASAPPPAGRSLIIFNKHLVI